MKSLVLVPRRSLFSHIQEVEDIASFVDALDRPEDLTPEATEQLQFALCEAIAGTKQKVDRVAATLAAFESAELAAKQEGARLMKRSARFQRNRERLELFVLAALSASDLPRIDGETSSLSRQKNPPSVVIDADADLPFEYLRSPVIPADVPDKVALKKALLSGIEISGARIVQEFRLVRS